MGVLTTTSHRHLLDGAALHELVAAVASRGTPALRSWEEWWGWFPDVELAPVAAVICGGAEDAADALDEGSGGDTAAARPPHVLAPREVLALDQVSQFVQVRRTALRRGPVARAFPAPAPSPRRRATRGGGPGVLAPMLTPPSRCAVCYITLHYITLHYIALHCIA